MKSSLFYFSFYVRLFRFCPQRWRTEIFNSASVLDCPIFVSHRICAFDRFDPGDRSYLLVPGLGGTERGAIEPLIF